MTNQDSCDSYHLDVEGFFSSFVPRIECSVFSYKARGRIRGRLREGTLLLRGNKEFESLIKEDQQHSVVYALRVAAVKGSIFSEWLEEAKLHFCASFTSHVTSSSLITRT